MGRNWQEQAATHDIDRDERRDVRPGLPYRNGTGEYRLCDRRSLDFRSGYGVDPGPRARRRFMISSLKM